MSATRIPGADLPQTQGASAADAAQRREVAKGLESYFLRQVFAELTKDGGGIGLAGGGFAGSTFGDMLSSALADSIAASGGLGVAAELAPDLTTADVTTVGALGGGGSSALALPRSAAGSPLGAAMRARTAYASAASVLTAQPVQGAITSRFGVRADPLSGAEQHHDGLDIAAPAGTSVKSAGPGVVLRAEVESGYGNVVVVDHGNGVETRYAHLSALHVKAGDRVAAGSEVGLVGSTGKSTGPHLHFEVRRGGKSVDPTSTLSPLARLR